MIAPAGLTPAARRLWDEAEADLRERREWRDALAPTLLAYVENATEARTSLRRARREPLVTGSAGQQAPHPSYAVAARCDGLALAAARQLGLAAKTVAAAAIDPKTESSDILDELASRRVWRRGGESA